jgi:hypothetical protein
MNRDGGDLLARGGKFDIRKPMKPPPTARSISGCHCRGIEKSNQDVWPEINPMRYDVLRKESLHLPTDVTSLSGIKVISKELGPSKINRAVGGSGRILHLALY